MAGEGKDVTLPTLDVDDFMGKSFTTGPDGKLYQLPDQQFANLYWFRYDWFKRPDFKKQFKEIYGYELGVPVNWSAYEDIAEFFTEHVREIDGKAVFGHNDYGKRPRTWAGALPMPGCPWPVPVTRAFPTANRWMNGASAWKDANPGGCNRGPRRRRQWPGCQIRPSKVYGLAAKIRTSGQPGHGFLHLPAISGQRQCRPADLLVHRLPPQHGRTGTHGQ
jgi:hypothetical protein